MPNSAFGSDSALAAPASPESVGSSGWPDRLADTSTSHRLAKAVSASVPSQRDLSAARSGKREFMADASSSTNNPGSAASQRSAPRKLLVWEPQFEASDFVVASSSKPAYLSSTAAKPEHPGTTSVRSPPWMTAHGATTAAADQRLTDAMQRYSEVLSQLNTAQLRQITGQVAPDETLRGQIVTKAFVAMRSGDRTQRQAALLRSPRFSASSRARGTESKLTRSHLAGRVSRKRAPSLSSHPTTPHSHQNKRS